MKKLAKGLLIGALTLEYLVGCASSYNPNKVCKSEKAAAAVISYVDKVTTKNSDIKLYGNKKDQYYTHSLYQTDIERLLVMQKLSHSDFSSKEMALMQRLDKDGNHVITKTEIIDIWPEMAGRPYH